MYLRVVNIDEGGGIDSGAWSKYGGGTVEGGREGQALVEKILFDA